ncbi:MAG: HAD hydrolase family protein [Myxococcota bacterium]
MRVDAQARAIRHALSPEQCDAVVGAVQSAAGQYPWLDTKIIHRESERPGLLREAFGSSRHPERVFQYSFLIPPGSEGKTGLLAHLQGKLAALGVNVCDAGGAVLIGEGNVDKGHALVEYAAHLAVPAAAIAKFGDKAGPEGNDRHLVGPNSYNVGKDEPACPQVDNRGRGRFAAGTVEIANGIVDDILAARAAGRRPTTRALMFDFDGTLTMHGEGIDGDAMALLLRLLDNGIEFSICTGRGPAIFPMLIEQMADAGADLEAMCRTMTLFMFNGARWVETQELAELLEKRRTQLEAPSGR